MGTVREIRREREEDGEGGKKRHTEREGEADKTLQLKNTANSRN